MPKLIDLNVAVLSKNITMISTRDIVTLYNLLPKNIKYANFITLLITAVFIRRDTLKALQNQLSFLNHSNKHLNRSGWEDFNTVLRNQVIKSSLKFSFESTNTTPTYMGTLLCTWSLHNLSFKNNVDSKPQIISDLFLSLSNPTNLKLNLIILSFLPDTFMTSQDTSLFLDTVLGALKHEDYLIRLSALLALKSLFTKIEQHDVQRVLDHLFFAAEDLAIDVAYKVHAATNETLVKFFLETTLHTEQFIPYLRLKLEDVDLRRYAANCLSVVFSKLKDRSQPLPVPAESLLSMLDVGGGEAIEEMLKAIALKLELPSIYSLFESLLSPELTYAQRELPVTIMKKIGSSIPEEDLKGLKEIIQSKLNNSIYGSEAAVKALSVLSSRFESNEIQDLDDIFSQKLKDTNFHVSTAAGEALVKLYLRHIPKKIQELMNRSSPLRTTLNNGALIVSALLAVCYHPASQEAKNALNELIFMGNAYSQLQSSSQSGIFEALLKLFALYPQELGPVLHSMFQNPNQFLDMLNTIKNLGGLFYSEPLLNFLLSEMDTAGMRDRATKCLNEFLKKVSTIPSINCDRSTLSRTCGISDPEVLEKLLESSSSVVQRMPDLYNMLLLKLDSGIDDFCEYSDLLSAILPLSTVSEPHDVQRLIESLFCRIRMYLCSLDTTLTFHSEFIFKSALSALSTLSVVLEPQDIQILYELLLAILRSPYTKCTMYPALLTTLSCCSDKFKPEDMQELAELLLPRFNSPDVRIFMTSECIEVLSNLFTKFELSNVASNVFYRIIATQLNHRYTLERQASLVFLCRWIVSHEIDYTAINIPGNSIEAIQFLAISSLRRTIAFEPYLLKREFPFLNQADADDEAPCATLAEIKKTLGNPKDEKHQRTMAGFCSFFKIDPSEANDACEEINIQLTGYVL